MLPPPTHVSRQLPSRQSEPPKCCDLAPTNTCLPITAFSPKRVTKCTVILLPPTHESRQMPLQSEPLDHSEFASTNTSRDNRLIAKASNQTTVILLPPTPGSRPLPFPPKRATRHLWFSSRHQTSPHKFLLAKACYQNVVTSHQAPHFSRYMVRRSVHF